MVARSFLNTPFPEWVNVSILFYSIKTLSFSWNSSVVTQTIGMDFTILAVVLLIGVGIPVRNKLIRKYREEKKKQDKNRDEK